MEEIWKDVINYEGIYQISNLGRIKRLGKKLIRASRWGKEVNVILKEVILKTPCTGNGYPTITLYKNNTGKTFSVHRLVAEAFIPNLQNKSQINHIDGVKTNNNISNLEWCSGSENSQHRFTVLNHTVYNKGILNIGRIKKVNQYTLSGEFIKTYPSISQAASDMGAKRSSSNIKSVLCGRSHYAFGYIWRYTTEDNCKNLWITRI